MGQANVFVVGLDETNQRSLEALPQAAGITFHPLLRADELTTSELDLSARIADAEQILRSARCSVDAVVGYWDFPVTSMVALLCRRFGLPGPRLEAVVRAEHKYWSRLDQAAVIDDVPGFALVPLDGDDEPGVPDTVSFPMWLKPVKGFSSQLAFLVQNEAEFHRALHKISDGIDAFSEPFDIILAEVDLPPEIARVGSRACIAEEAATGRQFTAEGYCFDDQPHCYGIVETVLYPGRPNFARYEYPADLPDQVVDRILGDTEAVIGRLGLGAGTFNVEYFWDEASDRLRLLEVNPRHSQSHADIFREVDGVANHYAMVEIGLGREPQVPHGKGEYAVAGKFFLRLFVDDGVVTRAPDADDIARIQRTLPGIVAVHTVVSDGMRLSELPRQDPYSYSLADIVVGGDDIAQLEVRYRAAVDALGFEVREAETPGEQGVDVA